MIWKILLALSVSANIWLSGYIDMPFWKYVVGMACFLYGLAVMVRYEREV